MEHGTESIIKLTKDASGINLNESKRSLIYNRLNKRLRELQLDLAEYSALCQRDPHEKQYFLDLITTNHTSFMREPAHFDDTIKRVIPALIQRTHTPKPKMRIWSAACSSGQEPYTLLIRLLETFSDLSTWDIRILGTDLSQEVLTQAKAATYTHGELKGLSEHQKKIAFDNINDASHDIMKEQFQIKQALRDKVSFAHLNLMENWRMNGPFDIIFCRNVMIYFDEITRARLINRFAQLLAPGGTLYIGHTESIHAFDHPLTLISPSIYEKPLV